jgi:hypothetical protein
MRDENGEEINSKKIKVPTWFDYSKILDPNDFSDLNLAKPVLINKAVEVEEKEAVEVEDPDILLRQNLALVINSLERSLSQSEELENSQISVKNLGLDEQLRPAQNVPETLAPQGVSKELDKEKRYTPSKLTKLEIIATAQKLMSDGLSKTKTIEQLWQVKKSRSGWSAAYREFKELGL